MQFEGAEASEAISDDHDLLVAQYDAGGALRWTRRLGASDGDGWVQAMAVDADGNLVVAGFYGGALDVDGTLLETEDPSYTFLIGLTRNGGDRFAEIVTRGDNVSVSSVAVSSAGDILLAGAHDEPLSIGDDQLQGASEILAEEMVVAKLDAAGKPLWARGLVGVEPPSQGVPASSAAFGVAVDARGGIFVSGSISGTAPFGDGSVSSGSAPASVFVARYSAEGDVVWALALPKTGGDGDTTMHGAKAAPSALQLVDDQLYLTGTFAGSTKIGSSRIKSKGGNDAFLATCSTEGELGSAMSLGGKGDERGRVLGVLENGKVVLGGLFLGDLTLGKTKLANAGGADAFVALVSP